MSDQTYIDVKALVRWQFFLVWGLRGVAAILVGLVTATALSRYSDLHNSFDSAIAFILLAMGMIASERVLRQTFARRQILGWVNARFVSYRAFLAAPETGRQMLYKLDKTDPVSTIGALASLLGASFILLAFLAGQFVLSSTAFFIQLSVLVLIALVVLWAKSELIARHTVLVSVLDAAALSLAHLGTILQIFVLPLLDHELTDTGHFICSIFSLALLLPIASIIFVADTLPTITLGGEHTTPPPAASLRVWGDLPAGPVQLSSGLMLNIQPGQASWIKVIDNQQGRDLVCEICGLHQKRTPQKGPALGNCTAPVFAEECGFVPAIVDQSDLGSELTKTLKLPHQLCDWSGGFPMDATPQHRRHLGVLSALNSEAKVVAIEADAVFPSDCSNLSAIVKTAELLGKVLIIVSTAPCLDDEFQYLEAAG